MENNEQAPAVGGGDGGVPRASVSLLGLDRLSCHRDLARWEADGADDAPGPCS